MVVEMATRSITIALLHPFFLILYFSSITTIAVAATKPQVIHLPLTHRDSPSSPFYDPSATQIERVEQDITRSILRFSYLNGITLSSSSTHDIVEADIKSGPGAYYVILKIGTPPFPVNLFIDTASDLTWTQCLPCVQCYNQTTPIFDPSKSQTYTNVTCDMDHCSYLPWKRCANDEICPYHNRYADGSGTDGYLGVDAFTFETLNGEAYVFTDTAFGCGKQNLLQNANEIGGILGLGYINKNTIMSQAVQRSYIEPKFSYCFMYRRDEAATNHLVLGAFFGVDSTPMEIVNGFYTVVLEDITVGSTRLNLPPGTFNKSSNPRDGGMLIDSGTTYTFLAQPGYDRFVEELERQFEIRVSAPAVGKLTRCYDGPLEELRTHKEVTFHFAGGLNLVMEPRQVFVGVGDFQFCLGVLPASPGRFSVIGNLAQQLTAVAFDLDKRVVAFSKTEGCSGFHG